MGVLRGRLRAARLSGWTAEALSRRRQACPLRFLLGVVHWYLDGALSAEPGARAAREAHALRPQDYDRDALRVYRGLDYGDLLGLWD